MSERANDQLADLIGSECNGHMQAGIASVTPDLRHIRLSPEDWPLRIFLLGGGTGGGRVGAPGAFAAHPQGDVTGMENKGLRGRRTWRQMAVTPMKASTTTRGGLEPTAALPGQVRHAPSAVRLHEHRVLGRLSQPPAHIRGSLSHK